MLSLFRSMKFELSENEKMRNFVHIVFCVCATITYYFDDSFLLLLFWVLIQLTVLEEVISIRFFWRSTMILYLVASELTSSAIQNTKNLWRNFISLSTLCSLLTDCNLTQNLLLRSLIQFIKFSCPSSYGATYTIM